MFAHKVIVLLALALFSTTIVCGKQNDPIKQLFSNYGDTIGNGIEEIVKINKQMSNNLTESLDRLNELLKQQ